MRRPIFYIFMCIALLASCQQEQWEPTEQAVLELELSLAGRPSVSTRAVDDDLTVAIFEADGTPYKQFEAGHVPSKIAMAPGNYRVCAYTDNQNSWASANGGRGAACYYGEASIAMEDDMVFRLKMEVPATNYAATLQLPDHFDTYFTAYTFTLSSGSRSFSIREGEKVFFDVTGGGFSYALSATNTDGATHAHSAIEFTDVAAGKLFTIHYNYDSDANSGGVVIVITDDMDTNDNDIHL